MTKRGRRVDRSWMVRIGREATWEKGMLCPNIGPDGRHPYACPYCSGGRGYQYIDSKDVKILFTSDRRENEFDLAGSWDQGTATGTTASHQEINDQDRIVDQSHLVTYNLTVERGSGLTDTLRVPNVVKLVAVRGLSTTYTVDADCEVDLDPVSGDYFIRWLGLTKPTEGDKYTVRLSMRPTWIVQGPPMVRSFGPTKTEQLLLRLALKRFDRAVDRDEQVS